MNIQTEFEAGYDQDVIAAHKAAAQGVVKLIAGLQRAAKALDKSSGASAVSAIEKGQKEVAKAVKFLQANKHLVLRQYHGPVVTVDEVLASMKDSERLGAGFSVSVNLKRAVSFLQQAEGYAFDTKLIKLDRDYA